MKVMAVLAAATLAMLAGCVPWGPRTVGDFVASWSQSDDDQGWVDVAHPIDAVILVSDEDRQAWIDENPGRAAKDSSTEALRAVDLAENVIVIGGYARCTEHSAVTISRDDQVTFEIRDDEPNTDCGWSPYTIDAWAVPLDAMDGEIPESVEHEPRD